MILNMFANAPENLPPHDNAMETGPMGDCVSVIVLWHLVGTRYGSVRGWHGMGGIEAINFPLLFNGVPNVAQTQVIIIASDSGTVTYLLDNVHNLVHAQLNLATIRVCKGFSNARVTRSGVVARI